MAQELLCRSGDIFQESVLSTMWVLRSLTHVVRIPRKCFFLMNYLDRLKQYISVEFYIQILIRAIFNVYFRLCTVCTCSHMVIHTYMHAICISIYFYVDYMWQPEALMELGAH